MPQRTKLTEDVSHRVVLLIRAGNWVSVTAEATGVHRSTIYSWVERGEADVDAGLDTIHARFAQAFTKAQAEAQVLLVGMVRAAAVRGDWRAAVWMLERRFPEQWGRKAVVEIVVERCHACDRREAIRRATRPEIPEPVILDDTDADARWTRLAELLRDGADDPEAER
jgi:transposase